MLDVLPLPILTSYETHKQQKIKVVTVIAVAQSFNMRENGGRLGGIPITQNCIMEITITIIKQLIMWKTKILKKGKCICFILTDLVSCNIIKLVYYFQQFSRFSRIFKNFSILKQTLTTLSRSGCHLCLNVHKYLGQGNGCDLQYSVE